MKVKDLRKLSNEELNKKLIELQKELMRLNTQRAQGALEKPGNLRKVKRLIARIKTIINERGELK